MENHEKYYRYALYLLAERDYSRVKLLRKLKQKGCEENMAQAILERLRSLNYWNEERYTRSRAAQFLRRGYSQVAVEMRLRGEGLPVASQTIREIAEDLRLSPAEQLRLLRQKRASLSEERFTRHALARGHRPQDIRNCLEGSVEF